MTEIKKVGVVGLGTMGAGIAQVSVQSGHETVGREVTTELAERGRATIERYLTRGVEKGRLSQAERDAAAARLTLTTALSDLGACDPVIDAVRCNDTPGFIVNRILIPLLNDCVRVLDEAHVPPEDMDKAMTNGAGWPMGPCALIDLIGIDVHVHASDALHGKLGEARMAPPERLVQMQEEGKLGRKSGEGFYSY